MNCAAQLSVASLQHRLVAVSLHLSEMTVVDKDVLPGESSPCAVSARLGSFTGQAMPGFPLPYYSAVGVLAKAFARHRKILCECAKHGMLLSNQCQE